MPLPILSKGSNETWGLYSKLNYENAWANCVLYFLIQSYKNNGLSGRVDIGGLGDQYDGLFGRLTSVFPRFFFACRKAAVDGLTPVTDLPISHGVSFPNELCDVACLQS